MKEAGSRRLGFASELDHYRKMTSATASAELHPAYFHLHGLARDDVNYILSTLQGIVKEDQTHKGQAKTRRQILDLYDEYAARK